MEWLTLDGVHWWAVAAATGAAFVVGMTWYAKSLFGNAWMAEEGLTEKQIREAPGNGMRYGMTAIAAFLTALLLNILMAATPSDWDWIGGLVFGAVLGLVFRLGAHVIHNGFALRSAKLTLIDGGHDIVSMAAAGAIIGALI